MTDKSKTCDFWVPIRTSIFPDWRKLKHAHFLLAWYIDRTVFEWIEPDGSRTGSVAAAHPINDADVARQFSCSRPTISRWRDRLAKLGFIWQRNTGRGYVIAVPNSQKRCRRVIAKPAVWTDGEMCKFVTQMCKPVQLNASDSAQVPMNESFADERASGLNSYYREEQKLEEQTDKKPSVCTPDSFAFRGERLTVTQGQHLSLERNFPGADRVQQYREIDCWLVSNGQKRIRHFTEFINQWFSRAESPESFARAQASEEPKPLY